jgi:hypothetical protein
MLPNLRGLKRFEDVIVAACECLTRIGCFEETIEECCTDMESREGGKSAYVLSLADTSDVVIASHDFPAVGLIASFHF